MLSRAPQDSVRTYDKDAPQVAIPLLGDVTELLLASRRVLSRHQADPGRKITSRSECLRVRHGRVDRGGANDANAGDRLEPPAPIVRLMLDDDPLLERADQGLAGLQLCRQHHQASLGVYRQFAVVLVGHNRK